MRSRQTWGYFWEGCERGRGLGLCEGSTVTPTRVDRIKAGIDGLKGSAEGSVEGRDEPRRGACQGMR